MGELCHLRIGGGWVNCATGGSEGDGCTFRLSMCQERPVGSWPHVHTMYGSTRLKSMFSKRAAEAPLPRIAAPLKKLRLVMPS